MHEPKLPHIGKYLRDRFTEVGEEKTAAVREGLRKQAEGWMGGARAPTPDLTGYMAAAAERARKGGGARIDPSAFGIGKPPTPVATPPVDSAPPQPTPQPTPKPPQFGPAGSGKLTDEAAKTYAAASSKGPPGSEAFTAGARKQWFGGLPRVESK